MCAKLTNISQNDPVFDTDKLHVNVAGCDSETENLSKCAKSFQSSRSTETLI